MRSCPKNGRTIIVKIFWIPFLVGNTSRLLQIVMVGWVRKTRAETKWAEIMPPLTAARRNDIQHNDIHQNDTQHKDIQYYNGQHCNTQHYNAQHNKKECGTHCNDTQQRHLIFVLSFTMKNLIEADCHNYAECHFSVSRWQKHDTDCPHGFFNLTIL